MFLEILKRENVEKEFVIQIIQHLVNKLAEIGRMDEMEKQKANDSLIHSRRDEMHSIRLRVHQRSNHSVISEWKVLINGKWKYRHRTTLLHRNWLRIHHRVEDRKPHLELG